ncbi:40S ribosomal protein S26-1-like [Iris pallida]|uniref:40S ribosomal protein S26-1-like n=1 Tax=Iris pallida TaxID=29817 RepID=A0AAX6DL72_IRIPA|nr:40S ribosomal protein S26-1-like [Iris pallida]
MFKWPVSTMDTLFPNSTRRYSTVFLVPSILMLLGSVLVRPGGTVSLLNASGAGIILPGQARPSALLEQQIQPDLDLFK